MGDSVSKTSAKIGFVLLGLICLVVGGGVIWFLVVVLSAEDVPLWLKSLRLIAAIGGALLVFAVVRQRIIDSKTDKYKDIEF